MSSIVIQDLTVAYPSRRSSRGVIALWHVNLAIEDGEFVTIVGPSGCGKTTLLNVIAGLVAPSEGRVLVDGRPVTAPGPDRAVVFQDYALLPWRTTWDNVKYGLSQHASLGEGAHDRIQSAIRLLGLAGFEHAYPRHLSGGMRQRVGLARALVADPKVLLMDEPFAAIDALARDVMQGELERIVAESNKTAILITHSIDEAIQLGDRVVVATTRPGRIKATLPVNLPRPRGTIDVRAEPEFIRLREQIWDLIRDEAFASAHGTATRPDRGPQ